MTRSFFDTLYIKDKIGRERQWNIWSNIDGPGSVTVEYGLVLGKKTKKVTVSKAKNIGKSNATTAEEQATKDAKSKHTAQIDRDDYHQDINLAGNQMRPMLALDYTKVGHRVNWMDRNITQPKLDGVRLTTGQRDVGYSVYDETQKVEMLTRKGETYNLPHIIEHSKNLLTYIADNYSGHCLALDGEAYIHGMPLGQILSRARKYQPGVTEELEYHLFDIVVPGMGFEERYNILLEAMAAVPHPSFKLVPIYYIEDEAAMKVMHGEFTQDGYEGAMIRAADGLYTIADRSDSLFKYKLFYDKECKVIDVWEDANGNAMLTCLWNHNDPTSEFRCTPKRTHNERKAMLGAKDAIVGCWITVKYQELSFAKHEGGIPTFNCGLDFRECDEDGNPIV